MSQANTNDTDLQPSTDGSVKEFDQNWKERKEGLYNHWVKGSPKNQVQLAFRSHWKLFNNILEGRPNETCLEVGCGRGSLSSYFADNGYKCTLLDMSESVMETAEKIFKENGHQAEFCPGNAMSLPFDDNSFDVITSIGLFEHFEDVETPLKEQWRVLKPNGTCLVYIVPERLNKIKRISNRINTVLKVIAKTFTNPDKVAPPKTEIFRSDFGSERYLPILESLSVSDIECYGMYSLPMISHSPEFPFSLLPKPLEYVLTRIFELTLWIRKTMFSKKLHRGNPWTCNEKEGNAFLIAFRKTK